MGDLRENMKFDPTIRRNIEGFVSNRVTKIIVIGNKSEKINYREVGTTGYITVPEEQTQDYQKIADELNAKYAAENQRDSESVDNDLIRLRRQQRVKDATEALQYFEPTDRKEEQKKRDVKNNPSKKKFFLKIAALALTTIAAASTIGYGVHASREAKAERYDYLCDKISSVLGKENISDIMTEPIFSSDSGREIEGHKVTITFEDGTTMTATISNHGEKEVSSRDMSTEVAEAAIAVGKINPDNPEKSSIYLLGGGEARKLEKEFRGEDAINGLRASQSEFEDSER